MQKLLVANTVSSEKITKTDNILNILVHMKVSIINIRIVRWLHPSINLKEQVRSQKKKAVQQSRNSSKEQGRFKFYLNIAFQLS